MLTALALAVHLQRDTDPFTYKKYPSGMTLTFLAWGGMLSRDVWDMSVVLRRVRVVDLSNCQPFEYQRLLCVHNGRIENFRQTLHRPLRDRLGDVVTSQLKAVPTQNTLRC